MEPPLGCADYGSPGIIWKLEKSLYSLKQASHAWYKKARDEFNCVGFSRCDVDYSVFIHTSQDGYFCIIALYVDDLMILSNDLSNLNHHKKDLMWVFKMKDLGPIHWFLGLEITRDRT